MTLVDVYVGEEDGEHVARVLLGLGFLGWSGFEVHLALLLA